MTGPDPTGAPTQAATPRHGLLDELAQLETTTEELRVVEETLQAQQRHLEELLTRHEAEQRWRTRLSAVLPIGLCVTDGAGKLLDANPAFADTLRVALYRLVGKPLSVYLAGQDTAAFRTALRELVTGRVGEHRVEVTLRPRTAAPSRAELFGFPETVDPDPAAARVQWVLVPEQVLITPGAPTPVGSAAEEAGPTPSEALATALAQLSALPVQEPDDQRLLSRMAALVRSAVPAASWVSITLGSPTEPRQVGSDSAPAQDCDGQQLRAAEGPCLDAYDTGHVVHTGDLPAELRWPLLAKLAADGPVRSVLALPVRQGQDSSGVLNVYSEHRHAFGPADRRIAELVAAAVTGVLQTVGERESMRRLTANLEQALTSRSVIDQAKGIVMAHLQVDADEAFARLVALSSRANVKLRDIARLLVEEDRSAVLAALGG